MLKKIKDFFKKIPFVGNFLLSIRDEFLELRLNSERNALRRNYPLRDCGINQQKRNIPIIVSLTSIPPRLKMLPLCLRALLSQSFRPNKVILWLSEYDRSGNKAISKSRLPKELLALAKRGLEIRFCEDIGSYRKLIPTLKKFPDSVIVTADDDVIYPKDWLKKLYASYQADPKSIHCYQARFVSFKPNGEIDDYLNWVFDCEGNKKSSLVCPVGVYGVLYPPKVLSNEVFNEDVFLKICPKADDIWFKAMSLKNNIHCQKVYPELKGLSTIPGSQVVSLFSENENRNDEQIRAVFGKYGLFGKLLASKGPRD